MAEVLMMGLLRMRVPGWSRVVFGRIGIRSEGLVLCTICSKRIRTLRGRGQIGCRGLRMSICRWITHLGRKRSRRGPFMMLTITLVGMSDVEIGGPRGTDGAGMMGEALGVCVGSGRDDVAIGIDRRVVVARRRTRLGSLRREASATCSHARSEGTGDGGGRSERRTVDEGRRSGLVRRGVEDQ
jgi:hypothetical protein